ncbi:nitroreductase family deazaflavin-dependent oxidoreductase [Xylanimonas sp. McL0601]|uniref:nitroreductase family deazaflavin-dependent oxidoreductase n=1 Tax=Xylanimonas sp. McL0601 TaxID=3414739 RepID=UPI003CE77105
MKSPLRTLRAGVAWAARTSWFRRVGPRVMPPFERAMARLTRERVTASGLLLPSLVLHTVGAKTGLPRQAELMCVPDGGTWLVAGSNYARKVHPAWSWNLLADPDAEIAYRGRRIRVTAALVPDDEREAVWATLERQYPGYRKYETASGRKLRIFRLAPR